MRGLDSGSDPGWHIFARVFLFAALVGVGADAVAEMIADLIVGR
jgi:hypothetical protein